MSLIGLVNLAEKLFNQTQGNLNEDANGSQRPAKTAQHVQRNESDEFRPSSGNAANEAGLFQVTQQSVFAGAASVLLVQQGATTEGVKEARVAPAAQASDTTISAGATANAQNADNAQVLEQLQSLNTALAALGLSTDEIAAVDQVAQLIKDFSPAAFTSLINQLQVLARESAVPGANATNGAGTQTGGFSIQELSIQFAGVNETVRKGGDTLQISAFQLQVSEVNLTLNNASTGQTAQIRAPQAAQNNGSTTAAVAKTAAA